ncbi:MAG: glutamine--tRNA ligase/YqeY domain fusion protein [Planctomycetes bacterium]|nr:glutamine--tRNA ligase/YqeY domain fusion protein [Planctomycetota bacterium]
MTEINEKPTHFIHEIIDADNAALKWGAWPNSGTPKVQTRFPPEPNGYLHIGHAKSICLNFGLAEQYSGQCNLRFDDTNPAKEEEEYVRSIVEDVRWLGFRWPGAREDDPKAGVIFSSNYFQQMYDWAVRLIEKGNAYVCDLTADETRAHRGTLTRPGKDSPFRGRSAAENLDLFARMAKGEFPDGSRTLRAKIDMASPNLNLRDPVMYRILHASHHNTGDTWCVYPMYDWAHGLEDGIEGITHSICTLEFENHRPLYDWFIEAINEEEPAERRIHHPQQIEFARLELTYTVMSKRKLLDLVKEGRVNGWDDPRMPTISGLRRRGYTPESLRAFCADIGVAKFNSVIDHVRLDNAVREHLNKTAPRRMAVLRPLKLVITNLPAGSSEQLDAINNPEDAAAGTRKVTFSNTLYIERDDFMETPPKGYFRLFPGNEVRLRYAFFVKCTGCVKDPATGEVTEVHCTYDPATRGGDSPDGRKVKGTIHWVNAGDAIDAEVRLYDHLFKSPEPERVPEDGHYFDNLNEASLTALTGCKLEPSLAGAACRRDAHGTLAPDRFQFERHGYFCADADSAPGRLVFNRTVSLRDTWAKEQKKK